MDTNFVDQNKDVYNRIARFFSGSRSFLWDDFRPLAHYAKDGDRILDLGCGNGRLYQLFADLSIEYTGFDQSEKLIEIAREKNPDQEFVVGEMTNLPFADGSFDRVYCIAAFHHLPTVLQRKQALSEMHRVLTPGGTLIMANWNLYSKTAQKTVEKGKWRLGESERDFIVPWYRPNGEVVGDRYYYGFDMAELEELLSENGFAVQDQYISTKTKKTMDPAKSGSIITVAERS